MCTALRLGCFFGRNLDLNGSYGEQICILPKGYPLDFRCMGRLTQHHALLGMALVQDGVPLWYDALNEKGLGMAALNFPGIARYFSPSPEKDNLAAFELITWVLSRCSDLEEACRCLENLRIVDIPFRADWPLSPLHWMVADRQGSLVVESTAEGMRIYENPVDVLTNNPPFPYQRFNLNNYRNLSCDTPEDRFTKGQILQVYCQGLGGIGLPGDVSSMSRFVRAAFGVQHALPEEGPGQVFHLLDSVKMIRGCCRTGAGEWDYTVYTSCMDLSRCRYYYTCYDNRQISGVDLKKEDLSGGELICFPLEKGQQIQMQN